MSRMRIDHVSYAAEADGMKATAARLAEQLGVVARDGGVHPRFGTRNMILPLADNRYLEVVETLDHPAADKALFGQAVRAQSERGGGWMAWVISVEDLAPLEQRLGRHAVEGHRHTPEGVELTWRQIGIRGLIEDPQLPFFVCWANMEHHPSTLARSEVRLSGLRIAGDPVRIREWLGIEDRGEFESAIDFDFEDGQPSLTSVTFETAGGPVTL